MTLLGIKRRQELSAKASKHLREHPEIKLDAKAREILEEKDEDSQMKWLTNPFIAFCIESLLFGGLRKKHDEEMRRRKEEEEYCRRHEAR